ncbi:NAD-dependent epimerase/dehydratase family protein [Vreelandella nanhaiensis]|uniref:NAD-dependent epimerase/dehydratase family protein n=1 Tax=Vreelandella nanhaiensis TaxID=1258546 RepID=A0A3S0Y3B6_9GAMM|nr:NAD-dependent epimerase/dehydratase family protein [Halomonas nanhaiensis]RUR29075.1 NAD-dependent epimerase/dehydratase family protein [Halomonas nanhaiensis]
MGGCGYIGSHTVKRLLEAGHEVIVLNNNSINKYLQIYGKKKEKEVYFSATLSAVKSKSSFIN